MMWRRASSSSGRVDESSVRRKSDRYGLFMTNECFTIQVYGTCVLDLASMLVVRMGVGVSVEAP